MPQWSGIMRMIEEQSRQICVVKIDESSTISEALEAAQLYATEGL
jgi:hypothetical protein